MEAEIVAEVARASIGEYCHEECNSFCCRSSSLILSEEQVELVTGIKKQALIKNKVLKKINNKKYSLYMGNRKHPCPALDKNKMCKIHNNNNRPILCKQFPVFIEGKTIKFSHRCPAVREKKFYLYEKQFIELGYKIEITDPLADSEFYKLDIKNNL